MACRGCNNNTAPVTTNTISLTRNPYEATAGRTFSSEWYGVSIGWQGTNDSTPRYLHPSEFYRAMGGDKTYIDGWVEFNVPPATVIKDDLGRSSILSGASVSRQYGRVSVFNAPAQTCGFCIGQMADVPWWDITNQVYMIRPDQTAVPYTDSQKTEAVNSGRAVFDRYQ